MNKVYAVGIGPGGEEFFTQEAKAALERAEKYRAAIRQLSSCEDVPEEESGS